MAPKKEAPVAKAAPTKKAAVPAVPTQPKHDLLVAEFEGLTVEAEKVLKGNKAAGARYRKHLSNITALAKESRKESLLLAPAA